MSWLLFCDESGTDHGKAPFEVRGGVAIHSSKVWSFVQDFNKAENSCFGVDLSEYKVEIKGSKLLNRHIFRRASQEGKLTEVERHNGVRRFLKKELQHTKPTARDYTAYSQACLLMAHKTFDLLIKHEAVCFASCIPKGVMKPTNYQFNDYLRNDIILTLQMFYWFLEKKKEEGLLILDQSEKTSDKRFIKSLENYYTKTRNGRKRSKWVVPSPIFVDSDLTAGVQAADLCLYCINWGFRRPEWKFEGIQREDIQDNFASYCGKIEYIGIKPDSDKTTVYGIIFVKNPYIGTLREK